MTITTSDSIKAISAALLGFQSQVTGVGKDSKNPAFKSKYASLESVVDTARPALQGCGIAFLQSGGAIVDGVMAMTTRLIHVESGEWIEGQMDICLGKRDPQGVGSAQTYAQRYHLMAMLGLPPVDDDGEAAVDRNNSRSHPSSAPTMPSTGTTLRQVTEEQPQATQEAQIGTSAQQAHFVTVRDALFKTTTLKQLAGEWERHLPVVNLMSKEFQEQIEDTKHRLGNRLVEVALEEIDTAKDLTELEVKFKKHYRDAADTLGIQAEYTKAKDARKLALEIPPKAANPIDPRKSDYTEGFDDVTVSKAERMATIGNTP